VNSQASLIPVAQALRSMELLSHSDGKVPAHIKQIEMIRAQITLELYFQSCKAQTQWHGSLGDREQHPPIECIVPWIDRHADMEPKVSMLSTFWSKKNKKKPQCLLTIQNRTNIQRSMKLRHVRGYSKMSSSKEWEDFKAKFRRRKLQLERLSISERTSRCYNK